MKGFVFALFLVGLSSQFAATSGSMKAAFVGCGVDKSCYGYPAGCIATSDCIAVVAGHEDESDGNYVFEAITDAGAYVAVGVSRDPDVEMTSLVGCLVMESTPGVVTLQTSYSLPGENTTSTPVAGIALLSGTVVDGVITCTYSRLATTTVAGTVFDFDAAPVHLMVAVGSAADESSLFHDIVRSASTTAHFIHDHIIFE